MRLSWTGTGAESLDERGTGANNGQTVDVMAHALGFGVGLLGGVAVAALKPASGLLSRTPQWLTGLLALVPLLLAWIRALSS